jgi:hypothetical protein
MPAAPRFGTGCICRIGPENTTSAVPDRSEIGPYRGGSLGDRRGCTMGLGFSGELRGYPLPRHRATTENRCPEPDPPSTRGACRDDLLQHHIGAGSLSLIGGPNEITAFQPGSGRSSHQPETQRLLGQVRIGHQNRLGRPIFVQRQQPGTVGL